MSRFKMLERAPVDCEIFVVGVNGDRDLEGIVEATRLSPAFHHLVLITRSQLRFDPFEGHADRITHWVAGVEELGKLLADVPEGTTASDQATIAIRSANGRKTIDLSSCVDRSYPITARFELIPASEVLLAPKVSPEAVQSFLADPSASWGAYSSGIPYPRHEPFRKSLTRQLKKFEREGPSASFTAWLPADDGSGATTALRQLCFDIAREGYPVLIAREEAGLFDFAQVAAFLGQAANRFGDAGVSVPETPWVIAFDAEHSQTRWEFIAGLCNRLKKVLRSVVVLVVSDSGLHADSQRRASGTNAVLGPPLPNTISLDEAVELGRHFGGFLPSDMTRNRGEWAAFIRDTTRTTVEGKHSLFWVALRFWLLRVPGAEGSLRQWLSSKLIALVHGEGRVYAGILEVAAFSKHRLVMPLVLLEDRARAAVIEIARDPRNALGLRPSRVYGASGVTFSHPLLAEEILRIGQGDPSALAAVGKPDARSLLDLELHLLGGLIAREAAGREECIPVFEELITTGLRVDPREAPRNYQARDRIVKILERAPDSLWDASQVFNHHIAKARRHLAIDPPTADWSKEACREQLELAENHLLDAIENIRPSDPDRAESPLNLHVSLALTRDWRARLEAGDGKDEAARGYRARAEAAYRVAQSLDADNSYVLENFARFKIRQAQSSGDEEERTALIVDAISLLELEKASDEWGRRDEPVLLELATAYDLLGDPQGRAMLDRLADRGSEAALVALAKLALRTSDSGQDDPALREAEEHLLRVPPPQATGRSRVPLYRVVSRRDPYAFVRRLEILEDLAASPAFPWPLQLRLEYGILLFQVGDKGNRERGRDVFREIREQMADRSGFLTVPSELKFLADPRSGFKKRLLTSMRITKAVDVNRNFFAVPEGWTVEIPFRQFLFGGKLRPGQERDCFIQFTNFGPQAVPTTIAD
jgi:hypothetical protein